MSRICLSFILLFLIGINNVLAQTPDWEWGVYATGDAYEDAGKIVIDSQGNIIQAGYFWSTSMIFSSDTLVSNGSADIYLAKYSQNGSIIWAKHFGGVEQDLSSDIAIDENDCFYICGYFRSDSLVLGSISLDHIGNLGEVNCFIAKFDNNGNPIWARATEGEGESNAIGIAYKNGFVYQTGWFLSDSIIIGNALLSCQDNGSFFISKYDSTGNAIWTKQAVGMNGNFMNNSQGSKIAIDNQDNVIVVGESNYSLLNFDSLSIPMSIDDYTNYFIVKYDSIGNALWVKNAISANWDRPWKVATDLNNNCYVVGSYGDDIYFETDTLPNIGSYDIFLAKYTEQGNEVWIKPFATTGHDGAFSMDIDDVGNLYFAGHFSSSNFMLDSFNLVGIGSADAYVTKLTNNGEVVWAKSIGSVSWDTFADIAVSSGNIYITGGANNTILVFGTDSIIIQMQNSYDMFLVKLGNCNLNSPFSLFNDTILCNNQTLQLNINEGVQYLWSTGETTPNVSITQAGLYSVFIADTLGCIKTDSLVVTFYNPVDYLINLGNDFNVCHEQLPINLAAGNNNFNSYNWNTSDTSQTIQIADEGLYIINASYECGIVSDSIEINLNPSPIINLGTDTILCNNQNLILSVPPATFYTWSNGATTQQISVNATGIYYINLIDSLGCTATDTISVIAYNPLDYELNLGNDTSICYAQFPINIQTSNPNFDTYVWNTGSQSKAISANQAGVYVLNATYNCGLVQDTILVNVYPDPQFNLGADTLICVGSSIELIANNGSQYLWNNGSTTSSITTSEAGVYHVEVTNVFSCKSSDEIAVELFYQTDEILPNDTTIFNNISISISAFEGFTNYQWSDGYIGITNTFLNEGQYYITANDLNGCLVKDSINISMVDAEIIIPGLIQFGQPLKIINLIDGCSIGVYNSIGQLVYANDNYRNNYFPLWSQATYFIKLTTPEGKEITGKSVVGF